MGIRIAKLSFGERFDLHVKDDQTFYERLGALLQVQNAHFSEEYLFQRYLDVNQGRERITIDGCSFKYFCSLMEPLLENDLKMNLAPQLWNEAVKMYRDMKLKYIDDNRSDSQLTFTIDYETPYTPYGAAAPVKRRLYAVASLGRTAIYTLKADA